MSHAGHNTSPMIRAEHVSIAYHNNVVVEDVSFTLSPREIMVVLGPNGSGKSTLIKAILGLVPYSGTIEVCGTTPKRALHHVGYVPQHFAFDHEFPITVGEFLMLSAGKKGKPRVDEVLEEVGMTAFEHHMLGKLSGGQLQRVLIARAILHHPQVLLLDEPTSGIDIEGVTDFYALLTHLNDTHHVSIVLISHELTVAYKFAHTIICLNKDLVCYGSPKEVLTREVVEQLYGENMALREHLHVNE